MKKLLFIILLLTGGFMFAQQKFQHSTVFPEKVTWTVQGKVLYGDYKDSEKGRFKKIVSYGITGGVRVWIIDYPKAHIKYTIRTKGSHSAITKERT